MRCLIQKRGAAGGASSPAQQAVKAFYRRGDIVLPEHAVDNGQRVGASGQNLVAIVRGDAPYRNYRHGKFIAGLGKYAEFAGRRLGLGA